MPAKPTASLWLATTGGSIYRLEQVEPDLDLATRRLMVTNVIEEARASGSVVFTLTEPRRNAAGEVMTGPDGAPQVIEVVLGVPAANIAEVYISPDPTPAPPAHRHD